MGLICCAEPRNAYLDRCAVILWYMDVVSLLKHNNGSIMDAWGLTRYFIFPENHESPYRLLVREILIRH